MARLTLDDSLFLDPRFRALARAVGEDSAIAKCVRAFRIGQRFWADDRRLVPEELWRLEDCEELIDLHLADRRDDGIYIRGSEEHFAWLLKKREASLKGGLANKERMASHVARRRLAKGEPQASSRLAHVDSPLTPALTLTLTPTRDKETNKLSTPKFSPEDLQLATDWIAAMWDGKGKPISVEASARTISELVRLDKYTHEDLRRALAFVESDEFWRKNAISPAGLRTKGKNGLTKIQNIMAKLAPSKQEQEQAAFQKRREEAHRRKEAEEAAYHAEMRRVQEEALREEAERKRREEISRAQ